MKLKKLCIYAFIVLSMFVILALPALAEPTNNTADVSSDTSSTTSSLTKEDLIVEEDSELGKNLSTVVDVNDGILGELTKGTKKLTDSMERFFLTTTIGNNIFKFIFPIGLFVMFMSWTIDVGKKAVDGTLYDGADGAGRKAFTTIFVSLLAGIIVISLSRVVLTLIDGIMEEIASKMDTRNLVGLETLNQKFAEEVTYKESSAPIIGWLITLWNFTVATSFMGLGVLCNGICYVVIYIKLASRCIKLSIYQGFSPLFFGLSTSEETKQYFKNYLMNYVLLSAQIVVISVLVAGLNAATWYAPQLITASGDAANISWIFGGMLINIIFTVLICKSSKFMQDMVR